MSAQVPDQFTSPSDADCERRACTAHAPERLITHHVADTSIVCDDQYVITLTFPVPVYSDGCSHCHTVAS